MMCHNLNASPVLMCRFSGRLPLPRGHIPPGFRVLSATLIYVPYENETVYDAGKRTTSALVAS